ncbi:MAG: glycosyltransferase family protein [Syntrophorhabdales bacterium]
MTINIVAVIQARMSSTRLPAKVLMDIAGKPMLYHVVMRARRAKRINLVTVATSTHPDDDPVSLFCSAGEVPCFRGSLDDVLDRFYQAARHFNAGAVVRITADCPLLDPEVMDRVVQAFLEVNVDYASNTLKCTYPDGLDVEVFSMDSLEKAWRQAELKSEREHVTPFIYNHQDIFSALNVRHATDLSALRWTVDEKEDLAFVRAVYDRLGTIFGMKEVLSLVRQFPELQATNAGFVRNEGYLKSLQEDNEKR